MKLFDVMRMSLRVRIVVFVKSRVDFFSIIFI